MKNYTLDEIRHRAHRLKDWLEKNEETHHLYQCVQKEYEQYDEALTQLRLLGLESTQLNIKTEFINLI